MTTKPYAISGTSNPEMKKYLSLDETRIKAILDIKLRFFNGELSKEEARKLVNASFEHITAEEFAFGEQHLLDAGITDDVMLDGMDDVIDLFQDVLVEQKLDLPAGHPIRTYAEEANALSALVLKMEHKLKNKFIKNEWLEIYALLNQINVHFSRKQHQLFSALERKGFDRPSKIMWTFDDRVRDAIKASYELLQNDKDLTFIEAQPNVIFLVRDILKKEREVLYPTSLKLISDEEFVKMRISDDEIGYCLIENPPVYKGSKLGAEEAKQTHSDKELDLLNDLKAVLRKHGIQDNTKDEAILDVATGRMTLEQINLIYKHLPIDLSYVDENNEVRFYTDTKHRIFPRSAGVIGRKVENCHPRESLDKVEGVINAFRSGEQDKAEFWLDKGDKFIYILFTAIRDEDGNYRGTLESMQEVAHIRSLKGSQRLLSWDNPIVKPTQIESAAKSRLQITKDTLLGDLIEQNPDLKHYMLTLSPAYDNLNNPAVFNTMRKVATLEMVSQIGGFEVNDIITKIQTFLQNKI